MTKTKRILSLVLAIAMLCAMAISASAYTYESTGDYSCSAGTCSYHAYATCTKTSWSALTELQNYTGSYTDYVFRTDVAPHVGTNSTDFMPYPYVRGTESTRIAGNSATNYTLYAIEVQHYINSSKVCYERVFAS